MRRIAKPTFKVREVFISCISTVENIVHKQQLTDCVAILEASETDFENKFNNLEIYQITQHQIISGSIGKKEMKVVYDYRLVRPGMPGNKYYSELKSAAPYG